MVKEKHRNWESKERRNDLKNRIRNVGISRLPTYKQLGEVYGVSKMQIYADMKKIVTEMDVGELDEMFTDFYQTDLKALKILQYILQNGSNTDRLKSINALITLQKGATELLEAFSKKSKVADKLEVQKVSYEFKLERPAEPVFEIVGEEVKKRVKNGK